MMHVELMLTIVAFTKADVVPLRVEFVVQFREGRTIVRFEQDKEVTGTEQIV